MPRALIAVTLVLTVGLLIAGIVRFSPHTGQAHKKSVHQAPPQPEPLAAGPPGDVIAPIPSRVSRIFRGRRPLAEVAGGIRFLHSDPVSVVSRTEPDGSSAFSGDYLPFGRPLRLSGASRAGFAEKETDGSGMAYFGARQYSQGVGRFSGVDPAASHASAAYAYAGNNPFRFKDSDGRRIELVGGEKDRARMLGHLGMLTGVPMSAFEEDGQFFVAPLPEDAATDRPFGANLVNYLATHEETVRLGIYDEKAPPKIVQTTLRFAREGGEEERLTSVTKVTDENAFIRNRRDIPYVRDDGSLASLVRVDTGSGQPEVYYSGKTVFLDALHIDPLIFEGQVIQGAYDRPAMELPAPLVLAHELGHAAAFLRGEEDWSEPADIAGLPPIMSVQDRYYGAGIWAENQVREEQGIGLRRQY